MFRHFSLITLQHLDVLYTFIVCYTNITHDVFHTMYFSQFNQLLGANISCLGFTKYSKEFAEQFCWTQGIYTNRRAYDISEKHIPYPGITPCVTEFDLKTRCE